MEQTPYIPASVRCRAEKKRQQEKLARFQKRLDEVNGLSISAQPPTESAAILADASALRAAHAEILRTVRKRISDSRLWHIRIATALYSQVPRLVTAAIVHKRAGHVIRGAVLQHAAEFCRRPYSHLLDRHVLRAIEKNRLLPFD